MTSHLEWGTDQGADTHSIQELDQLLDKLTTLGNNTQPFSVDLVQNSGETLSIVVGGNISPVNFYTPNGHPIVVGCSGAWEENEGNHVFIFDGRGSYSEIEKRFTVPITDAREAMRRFLANGQRPENINWNS